MGKLPRSIRVNTKTTSFDQIIVAIQLVLEQASMPEIVFLYNKHGVLDLADLKQQAFVRAKEPDPIPSPATGRNGDDHISIFGMLYNSRIHTTLAGILYDSRKDTSLGSVPLIERKNRINMRSGRNGGRIFFNTRRSKGAKAQEQGCNSE